MKKGNLTRDIPIVILSLFLLLGFTACKQSFVKVKTTEAKPCINKADYPNSIILEQLEDPCMVHKVVVTSIKTGVVLEEWRVKDLRLTVALWKNRLEQATRVSAKTVKDVIIKKFIVTNKELENNKKIGAAVFVISEAFLEFSDDIIFESDDIKILILALDDVDRQLAAMEIFE